MKRIYMILLALCPLLLAVSILSAQEAELQKAKELNTQMEKFYEQEKYAEAIPLALEALRIRERALGPDHPDVVESLNNLAILYDAMGAYGQAEPLYQRALKIDEKALGVDHLEVAADLNNLAVLYYNMGAYGQAEPLYQRALKILEAKLCPDDPKVAQSLDHLAELYYNMGAYDQAEPLHQRALKILEAKLGPDDPEVAYSLDHLAKLYCTIGAYDQAEPLCQRVLKILEAKLDPNHPSVASSLNNLAELYYAIGAYGQAEPLYQRAKNIYEAKLGPDHPFVATSLGNLAALYRDMGAYGQAEPLYQRALKIDEKALGVDRLEVATDLNNLAELYRDMGAYDQAEPLCQQALKIREAKLGPDHPDVATSLNSLARLFYAMRAYGKAEPLYQRAMNIYEAKLGPNHPAVATSLNNLAVLYRAMGAYGQAEPLYQRALKIREAKLGPNHSDVAQSLNNLAELYRAMGAYGQAEPLYQRALKIVEAKLGPEHPYMAGSLNNMLYLWGAQGNLDQIMPVSKQLLQLSFHHYHTILPYLSEKRQLDYVQQNSPLSPLWPSLYVQYGRQSAELKPMTSEVLLNQKGIIYEILTRRTRSMKPGGTTLQDSLNSIRARLANAYFTDPAAIKSPEQHLRYVQLLQAQQERFENQLARQGFGSATPKTPITPAQLCQALPEDYALVDFWYFPKYNFVGEKKGPGTWQYLAMVYQQNTEPEILQLGEADSLHNRLSELLQTIFSTKLDTTQTKQQHLMAEALIKAKGRQLYQQLFKPLLSAIGDKKKVIICADGALHYLPFGVLVDEQNRYLVESYQFHYVSTGRELLKLKGGPRQAIRDAVIIADPQFEMTLAEANTASSAFVSTRSRDWRQMGFSALKYTAPEAVAIEALLKRYKIATKLYLKDQAKESVLKAVHSPHVLHLSTHGFFLPAPEPTNPPRAAGPESFATTFRQGLVENPLLRCGLALAGANRAESIRDGDDGLATALEIAGLDLAETDLVTLSACQTGIGDLKGSEGLYGLHRSFLLAGAKTVLASLWSVPDLETKDLMVEFYRRYLSDEKMSKSEALRQAQLAVIEQLRKRYGAAPPAYWGAFVCIGEP